MWATGVQWDLPEGSSPICAAHAWRSDPAEAAPNQRPPGREQHL